MGLGFRIFLFDDNDRLHRLSMARYDRLFRGDAEEYLPQYAGKRVRCATVILEVEDRKPVSIVRAEYSIIAFDAEGRVDASELEKEMHIVGNMLSLAFEEKGSAKIVDATSLFAKKRYKNEFKWIPTPEIEYAIADAIFGQARNFPAK